MKMQIRFRASSLKVADWLLTEHKVFLFFLPQVFVFLIITIAIKYSL